jgi:hypothetical protein
MEIINFVRTSVWHLKTTSYNKEKGLFYKYIYNEKIKSPNDYFKIKRRRVSLSL